MSEKVGEGHSFQILFKLIKEWNSIILVSLSFFFSLGPNELSFMDYVREGWRREQVEDSMDSVPKDWLKTGDSGWDFVFQIFSLFSQIFYHEENWRKNKKR